MPENAHVGVRREPVETVASVESARTRVTFFPVEVPRASRPRASGITHVLDRLNTIPSHELAVFAPYMDYVKIGWGLPLLVGRSDLNRRIRAYHDVGLEVSTGGTLLEYAVAQNRVERMLDDSRAVGFDLVEISGGALDVSSELLERLAASVRARGLDYFIEVGKKDPQHQLSLRETSAQITFARTLKPRKVILEGAESGRGVGVFDASGSIKWDWVHTLIAEHPVQDLIFEAPVEAQQVQLLEALGADVNLGNIPLPLVPSLASARLGLRGETFGRVRHDARTVRGPPAAKFLYFLLETHHGLDQTQLAHLSRLPRRTVQSALESLRKQGLVQESVSLEDSRRREYRTV